MFFIRVIKANIIILLLTIIISGCDSGCIDADDNGNMQKSKSTTIYPINPDVVSDVVSANTEFSASNIGVLSLQYLVKPGTTNENAMKNIWELVVTEGNA
jgi:hypothetical protein